MRGAPYIIYFWETRNRMHGSQARRDGTPYMCHVPFVYHT
jgi:hypothetical protein